MIIYTVVEAARILKLKPLTVAEYIREGKLKGFKIGKEWRLEESDLKEFIETKRAERGYDDI